MSFVADLEKHLSTSLITDPDITATYSKDQAPFAPSAPAAAVLLARSTEEISLALAFCSGVNALDFFLGFGLSHTCFFTI